MEEAERIARDEHASEKLAVISGVGTRHYYRRVCDSFDAAITRASNCRSLGYELDGPYMSKNLLQSVV